MKKLILVRHAETSSDKSDPKRLLTVKGMEQAQRLGSVLRGLVTGSTLIVCSETDRAMQTGKIIAEELGLPEVEKENIRAQNLDRIKDIIEEEERAGRRPARTFLSLTRKELNGAESPKEFSKRFMKILKGKKAETIIAVSHEGSLEAILQNQKKFKLIKKSFKTYFDNCDFALLIKV